MVNLKNVVVGILLSLCVAEAFLCLNLYTSQERLANEYGLLNSEYNTIVHDYQILSNEYDSLFNNYGILEDDLTSLQEQYSIVSSNYSLLQEAYDTLIQEFEDFLQTAESNKWEFYYASIDGQRFGVYDLDEFLDRWRWIDNAYLAGIFDCSEMSAYLEWKLENEGYHTYIACGPSPSNPSKRHAWLLVETSEGQYMPVEATWYDIVWRSDSRFDSYFEYDHLFETIKDALDYDYNDFNWWGSYYCDPMTIPN